MSPKILISHKSIIIKCAILFLIPIILFASGCGKKPQIQIPPRLVETAIATQRDVPIYIDSFGNLTSLYNVNIQSQVTGKLQEYHFNEGDTVKKGDLLFTIDPSEYRANLDKAEASVAEDMAELKLKQDTLARNKTLIQKNVISQQDYETYETDVALAEARLRLDQAQVELQKINLGYCKITSPIDGITGKRQVDPGNIIPANTGPVLVNIKSIDPLYIDFTIIERDLQRARSSMAESKLTVEIITDDNKKYSGSLEFLDNAVDNTTGTVSLRAIIPNPDRKLWSGQFVRVRLILGTQNNAVLVPYQAPQIGLKGYYVFTVTSDNKADLRQVKIGSKQDEDIVIEDGVKAGEKVVTLGQMGLSPGVSVMDKAELAAQQEAEKSNIKNQKSK